MAMQIRVERSTEEGAVLVPVEKPVEQNAQEVKKENQALGIEMLTSSKLTLSKAAIGVLEKFAKKNKVPVEIVGYDINTLAEQRKPVEKKIIIYNPINIETFPETYNVKLNDMAPTAMREGEAPSTTPLNVFQVKFINDRFPESMLHGTPFHSLFTDNQEGSIYIAFAIQNEIILNFDLLSEKSLVNDFLRKSILMNALKQYESASEQGLLSKRNLFDRRILDNYMRFIRTLKNNSRSVLRNRIHGLTEEINGHYRAIQNLEKQASEASFLSASISRRLAKNKHDTDMNCVSKMMEPLLTQNKYKLFEFPSDGQSLVAYTNHIDIELRGKKYAIGEFRIIIKLDGTVTMENLTNRKDDYDHPHVHDLNPCLGNIKEQVQNMIKDFNFMPLFDLLHRYLCTYVNEEHFRPYVNIGRWSGVEWCEECDNPRTECSCHTERCPSCEEPISDCGCERCPRTNRLMDDTDCGECDYNSNNDGCTYQ